MFRRLLTLLLLLGGSVFVHAQVKTDTVIVFYHQGRSDIDLNLRQNQKTLDDLVSFSNSLVRDSSVRVTRFLLEGFASPEGGYRNNIRLSEKRARRIADYLGTHSELPDSSIIYLGSGIDWYGLADIIEDKDDVPYKDEVLDILRNTPEWIYNEKGEVIDGKKRQLGMLRGGVPYNYLYNKYFPLVRRTVVTLSYYRRDISLEQLAAILDDARVLAPEKGLARPVVAPPIVAEQEETIVEAIPQSREGIYAAVKTNLLFDALLTPNLGAEIYLGNNWSAGAGWTHAWWSNDEAHRYWRIYGADFTVRKWFGKKARIKPLQGQHLGLYAQVFTYDFEFGGRGYMGGEPNGILLDRANYAIGLEYGYSLPLARRLNLDFTLGIGYMGGQYYEYEPIGGLYVWDATKQRVYFGPTKAEISLIWLIGRNNYNNKGGRR